MIFNRISSTTENKAPDDEIRTQTRRPLRLSSPTAYPLVHLVKRLQLYFNILIYSFYSEMVSSTAIKH